MKKLRVLLNHNLLVPSLQLKNLGLYDRYYIIIPDVTKKQIAELIRIFQFFNRVKLHEIKGKYFLYGFQEPREFESGVYIKIYFPHVEQFEFFEEFKKVFRQLNIKH